LKKVLLLNNWGETPAQYLEHCRSQNPDGGYVWEDIVAVSNLNDAEYCFVLDGLPSGFNPNWLNLDKTFFLQREPTHVRRYTPPAYAKHIYTYDNHYTYALWWVKKTFSELKNMKYPEKIRTTQGHNSVSCILTNKRFTLGQSLRLNFAKMAAAQHSDRIDFYGKTLKAEDFGPSYKGGLPLTGPPKRCKYEGLQPYHYSLSLENGRLKNFCTRVWEPFLCWTMPIYWGCPNIEELYPTESYHTINIENPTEALREFSDIIDRPITKINIDAIDHARNLVLEKYNIWPFIKDIIDKNQEGEYS
tara:strand:+ start:4263 stop:5171 length:909 start_codon:yes stop_codon:yes gene_type:complete